MIIERIVLAALSTFAKKRYADATMDEIARYAGLTKAALYWHFENKLDLYEAVVELVFQKQMNAIFAHLTNVSSHKETIEAVVKATVDFYRNNELVMESTPICWQRAK